MPMGSFPVFPVKRLGRHTGILDMAFDLPINSLMAGELRRKEKKDAIQKTEVPSRPGDFTPVCRTVAGPLAWGHE